jgi:hypothetical protein
MLYRQDEVRRDFVLSETEGQGPVLDECQESAEND